MRFGKRIRICKGLSLNLSKSGASLTAGRKGASVNIGTRGTFINAGIPGTGLSTRKKIGGSSQRSKHASSTTKKYVTMNFTVTLDEAGKPIIKDNNGNIIADEGILKQLKRQDSYKEVVRKLIVSRKENLEKANKDFIDIYKSTPQLGEVRSYVSELNGLKFEEYVMEKFLKERPSIDKIKAECEAKAKNPINKLFFWKKAENNTDNDPSAKYQKELSDWESEKRAFEESERKRKESEDTSRIEIYNQRKNELESKLNNLDEAIEKDIDAFLGSLTLPVEFSMDYQFYKTIGALYIDLDLPEIEDMPQKKAIISASGKLSIKPKTNKELKEDYARCVIGMAFYFAGNFFNICSDVKSIMISGYTQRLSKKSGNIEDEYVYSINFDKGSFRRLNVKSVDPIEAIQNFEHVINLTSTHELKVIKPLPIISAER